MAECMNKTTGKPLSAYDTKKEADESAKYAKKNFGTDLYAYQCEKCGKFHLAPRDSKIDVKQDACSCRDSNGNPKALYGSKKDAEKQMVKSSEEQHIKLRVYKCPEGKGYHLTHTLALEDRSPEEQAAVAAKKKAEKEAEKAAKAAEKKIAAKASAAKKAAETKAKKTVAVAKKTAEKKVTAAKAEAKKTVKSAETKAKSSAAKTVKSAEKSVKKAVTKATAAKKTTTAAKKTSKK